MAHPELTLADVIRSAPVGALFLSQIDHYPARAYRRAADDYDSVLVNLLDLPAGAAEWLDDHEVGRELVFEDGALIRLSRVEMAPAMDAFFRWRFG